jgi:signal transduction histidine kinase
VSFRLPAPYFLASIALVIALVAFAAVSAARRTQTELTAQLVERGRAVADGIERTSRNAIRSNAIIEETIAARLLDDARLVDDLIARGPESPDLSAIAARHQLRRIDLLDLDGRPWTPPPAPAMPHRMMMRRSPGEDEASAPRPMMRYMWGRRWPQRPAPGDDEAQAPVAITERKFWEGTLLGVAIGARSFRGIIAVHADAASILEFRREIGVEREIEELGRQPGVAAVALLATDLTIRAHSDPAHVGERVADPVLAGAAAQRDGISRLVETARGKVLRVVRPLSVDGSRVGVLAIDFSTDAMQRAWHDDVRAGVTVAAAIVAFGAFGLGLIFWVQHRRLSDVKRLENQMAQRERVAAMGDVAAAFAHEVRNPLNAVSMGLQRLRMEFTPEPAGEYTRFVDLMQGEVRRLNTIVEQFIALARPLPLTPMRFDVAALVHEVADLVDAEARSAAVDVRVAVPDGVVLTADRDHMKQVLLNLALNAIGAMKASGGAVTLAAHTTRGRLTLTVEDTGPGMSPDIRPRIFDPYFTTRRDGLGLGLTIVRRIVEAHGGTVDVTSEPGHGAIFRVSLPVRAS